MVEVEQPAQPLGFLNGPVLVKGSLFGEATMETDFGGENVKS